MNKHYLGWLTWFIGLSLAILWRLQNIDAFSLINDEGAYLMWAKLVAADYPLYSQTHSVSAPFFIEMLAWFLKLFALSEWQIEPMVQGRIVILGWFILLACLMTLTAKSMAGWPGVWITLILVTIPTPLFSLSRQVMAEIPATVLALAAVVCGQWAMRGGKGAEEPGKDKVRKPSAFPPLLFFLSGLLLALSLLMKPLYSTAILPIAYFIIRARLSWTHKVSYGLLFGGVLGLILLIPLGVYDCMAFYDHVILFRRDLRAVSPWHWQHNWTMFLSYAETLWGIGLLALAGLICTVRQVPTQAWSIWLGANWLMVMWHSPIFFHHFIIVLAPCLFLAISFVAYCQNSTKDKKRGTQGEEMKRGLSASRSPEPLHRLSVWGWLLIGLAALSLPELIQLNQGWTRITTGGREAVAAQLIEQITRPNDFVISDSQQLVLFAKRLTPPPLGDIALVAIKTGRQNAERLITLSEVYQVQAVAPWALRLPWVPDYLTWVEQNYFIHKVWDNDHQLFFGRKHPPQMPIPNEQPWRLGDHLFLRGYSVAVENARMGGDLPLTLYWQTEATLKIDYTIFVQILNAQGQLVAQNDSQPMFGHFPSTQWPVNEIIPDRVAISLPSNLPEGDYTIIAGMYDLQTMEHLKVFPSDSDYVTLTKVRLDK